MGLFRVNETNDSDLEEYVDKIIGITGNFAENNFINFTANITSHIKYINILIRKTLQIKRDFLKSLNLYLILKLYLVLLKQSNHNHQF